ncbi:MAG: adenylate/guanylate cyclase domain-containing protein [Bacteroidota bacterium]
MNRLFTLTLLGILVFGPAQASNPDSLLLVYQNASLPDTQRLDAGDHYYWYMVNERWLPDTLLAFAEAQLDLAWQSQDSSWINYYLYQSAYQHYANGLYRRATVLNELAIGMYEARGVRKQIPNVRNNLALAYLQMGQYDRAYREYAASRKLYLEFADTVMATRTLSQMANIRDEQGHWMEALDLYYEALKTFEKVGDQYGQSVVLINLAAIYQQMGDMERTQTYLEQSLPIKEEVGDSVGIGIILSSLGDIERENGNYTEALRIQQQALSIYESRGQVEERSLALRSLGDIALDQEQARKALNYYQQAIDIQQEIEVYPQLTISYNKLGDAYLALGNPRKSLHECRRGYELAAEIGQPSSRRDNCECLSQAYSAMGFPGPALEYLQEFVSIRDSLVNIENARSATRKDLEYNFEREQLADSLAYAKSSELREVQYRAQLALEEDRRIILLLGLSVVIIFAGFMYNRFQVTRRQRDIISSERERSENLLLNILPKQTAEELKMNGKSPARKFEEVSVLFTDFKGFTKMAETLTPEQLVAEIDYCYQAFDRITERYGVEKIKTIGDAYMCASGLPQLDANHAQKLVKVGLEIRNFMLRYQAERTAADRLSFQIRIGIHSGPVVAGIVGSKKFAYDIWGDTVNIAARIEDSGLTGTLNISADTYDLVKEQFYCVSRGQVEAKNKGMIEMYLVEGAKEALASTAPLESIEDN